MAELNIDIVAVDRKIWSGQGTFLFTRTTTGEIGILPHHIPLVAQLVDDAMVRVEREGEKDLRIAVHGCFMWVTEKGVSILAESAEFESEIDEAAAQRDAESEDPATAARCRARLRALGQLNYAGTPSTRRTDERVHDDHGRAGRCAALRSRRAVLPAVEAAPG